MDSTIIYKNICKLKKTIEKLISRKNINGMNLIKFIQLINSAYCGICKNKLDKISFTSIIKSSMIEVNDNNNIVRFNFCKTKDAIEEFNSNNNIELLFYVIHQDGLLTIHDSAGNQI